MSNYMIIDYIDRFSGVSINSMCGDRAALHSQDWVADVKKRG